MSDSNISIRNVCRFVGGAPRYQVESTKLRFREGDIIFGKRRAYQRKLAVAAFEGICSAHAMVLRARPSSVIPEFLPFFMHSDVFMERARAISVGSLSPTINWKTLAAEEFVLPPLDEQRKFTAVLRASDEAVETLRDLRATTGPLRRALLTHCFRPDRGVRDVFPPHWSVRTVGGAGHVQLGQQRHPMYEAGPNMRPYLRVANVLDGEIDLGDVLSMNFPEASAEKFELRTGDILLNEGQSTELVGRSAIYRGELPGACFQKTLLRFRPGASVLPEFAHAYFQHVLYTKQFARIAVQTTSMAHLTAVRFSAMPFPIPPLAEQEVIRDQLALLDQAAFSARRRLERAEITFREILRALFES